MKQRIIYLASGLIATLAMLGFTKINQPGDKANVNASNIHVLPDDPGLKLPVGFTAVITADNLGSARHIAITPQGKIFVKLAKLNDGKGIVQLTDANGDGVAEKQKAFGKFVGTGMYVKEGYLYASSNEEVFRYKLNEKGDVIDTDKPEKIVTGLINRKQHETKSLVLDNNGNIYVNIGAYSNACQEKDRAKGSKGMNPCPILDSAGGIWQFKANQLNQTYGNGVRYATGLRNVVGLDWNTKDDQLFVMQHGRDQLFQLYPELYDAKQSAELPAETLYAIKKGDNCGWPYVYYDQFQKKKIVAPEYGGDGKTAGGENVIDPVVAFPGHLAPNGLLFYNRRSISGTLQEWGFHRFSWLMESRS